ncbi:MAG: NAD-dependent dehydratase [Candidatus Pacebacteria bacterium CG_4_10_14_0_8_um_filter_43_12]|nr:MAG: NAD-dependent dehydratase [Candidatus Pacebacteria bacterium CG_4_10_14_0_8_um_filter_43_12]
MSFFENKTVVVTGGAGFVGSHLCQALLAEGAKVVAVDNLITGSQQNLVEFASNEKFLFIKADVIKPPLSYLPADLKIDLILHFASPASPPRYQEHPVETYLVNSLATHNLLQYLKESNPQARFLFASTSEVYGDPQEHPQKETYWGNVNPNGPRSCYDEGKRLGETICGVHQRDFKMDVRIVRIFNTYGPRMDIDDGRVIPSFIKESLMGGPLSMFGDGSQTRSYCYVSDLVAGVLKLAAGEGCSGQTVNLGNPGEFTVLETAKLIWQQIHGEISQPELVFSQLPTDDPLRRQPDISRAKEILGWQPIVEFKAGLVKTVEYFKANQTN